MPYNSELTRIIRTELSLSQFKFGVLIGRTPQTVHNWENGRHNPDFDTIDLLYEVCCHNGINDFPCYKNSATGETHILEVKPHYEGKYTVGK
jgi:transcriptional regulator with XRE-family HTH domain